MNFKNISIHQSLHGYKNGHAELACSVELSKVSRRQMSILSDLSGSMKVKGFESYITGYPIEDSNYYAFSKTWLADEMPRPGCVWSHSLIIQKNDLSKDELIRKLPLLFRRPSLSEENFEEYENLISGEKVSSAFKMNEGPNNIDNYSLGNDKQAFLSIFSDLCNDENKPVFILGNDGNEFDRLVVDLWMNQWRNLKEEFTFCTGALSARQFGEGYFKLQIMPRVILNEASRGVPGAIILRDVNSNDMEIREEKWINLLEQQYFNSKSSEFLNFIKEIGPEEYGAGSELKFLAILYSLLKRGDSEKEAVEQLFDGFNSKNKTFILLNLIGGKEISYGFSASFWISLLLTTEDTNFSEKDELLIMNKIYSNIKKQAVYEVLSVLQDRNLNIAGDLFLRMSALSVAGEDFAIISNYSKRLLPMLIEANPKICINVDVWKLSKEEVFEAWRLLIRLKNVSNQDVDLILKSILSAKNEYLIFEVEKRYSNKIASHLLNWAIESKDNICYLLESKWSNLLWKYSEEYYRWINEREKFSELEAILISKILMEENSSRCNVRPELVLPLVSTLKEFHQQEMKISVSCYFLAKAFQNLMENSRLVSFELLDSVHDAAKAYGDQFSGWYLLADICPPIKKKRAWDKCERIRLAFLKSSVKFKWSLDDLGKYVNKDLLDRLYKMHDRESNDVFFYD